MLILGWVLLGALVGGTAANYRGFGNFSGVVIGAILGPFSVLMFLASNGKKHCPQCAEWIPKKASVCPHCRSTLGAMPTPLSQ